MEQFYRNALKFMALKQNIYLYLTNPFINVTNKIENELLNYWGNCAKNNVGLWGKNEVTLLRGNNFNDSDICDNSDLHLLQKSIVENKKFNQSAIALVYKVKDMKPSDRITLNVIKLLLTSTSTRLLINKLREQEQLVYSADASNRYFYGFLRIRAYVDADKLDYTKDKILEVMEDLKNEKLITPLIPRIVEEYKVIRLESLDNKQYLLDDIMDEFFEIDDNPENVLKQIENVSFKDIKQLVNRLVLDTIYYIKEDSHE